MKLTSNILLRQGSSTKFDQMETTDGEQSPFCTENIRFLDLVRKPKFGQLFLKAFFFRTTRLYRRFARATSKSQQKKENETRSAHTQGTQFTTGWKPGAHGPGITTHRIRKARGGCELLTELQGSVKSEPCEEIKGSFSLSSPLQRASQFTQILFLQMKQNGKPAMHIHQMNDTWQLRYPRWLQNAASLWPRWKTNWWFKTLG